MNSMAIALFVATALIVSLLLPITLQGAPAINGESTGGTLTALANTQPKQLVGNFGNYTVTPGTYDPNHEIIVTVSFTPQQDLQSYLNLVSNPNSPDFHAFLTPSQIASIAGTSVYQQAVSYFQSFGLQVMTSATGLTLSLQGTVAQLSKAFHTSIGAFNLVYHTKGIYNALFGNESAQSGAAPSISFYANTEPLYLPPSLASAVNGVTGLDGVFATPQIMVPAGWLTAKPNTNVSAPAGSRQINVSAAVNITNSYFGWFNLCDFFGCGGNEPYAQVFFPSTLPAVVGAKNMWAQGYTGKGITIAVVEVGCIDPTILSQFSQETFGNDSLLNRFTQIGIDEPSLQQCIADGWHWGWTIETALDIEYAAAMAPQAHIDLVGVPNPQFSSFDLAYQVISSYLSPGSTCSLPSYVTAYDGNGSKLSQLPATACPIDITSHSYGTGETYTAYYGSPMYLTAEDQLIESMALEGITNFFAAGDSGSYFIDLESFIPASSPGSTPVGGGSVVVADKSGNPFPNTGVYANFCYNYFGRCFPLPINLANATQIVNYTYWSYGFLARGDYQGVIGGGFGQSISLQQPWWEMGLDIYNTGQLIIPVISGSADFEMSIYTPTCPFPSACPIGWQFAYGGTSFATPIQAGEWALIESEVSATTGLSRDMGDINPLLFLAHDAAQLTRINPYTPMSPDIQSIPNPFPSAGAENYYDSYLLSLGYTYPVDRNLPAWYATMNNPQGSGWNYLQGLGMTADLPSLASAISQLALPQFKVVLSNGNSFTSLTGGNTYSLTVEYANGTAIKGHATIVAYSGDTYNDSGTTFINGTTSNLVALSGGGFSYTPLYTPNSFNAPEYGYFVVNDTTFIIYQVTPPLPTSGTLQVGIDTPYGLVTSGSAQVPMFTMLDAFGYYLLGAQGVVLLNGQPVSNAVVKEVAVQVNYSIEDPTFPSQYYGPGITVGQFITDGRGNFEAWTNGFTAENNGPVPTQIFEVYAQYGALQSQPVYLYVEPQNGIFYTSLSNNYQTNTLVGVVSFTAMRYVTNITVYTNDGQKVTETFPSGSYSSQSGNASGIFQGVVPINFTLPPAGTPSVVNVVATGQNNESFVIQYCFFGFCSQFGIIAVSQPITWQYSIIVPNPGPEPTASVTVPQGVQGGTVKLSWAGSWVLNTATAQLQLISQSGSIQNLSTQLSGSLNFDTTTVPDGVYSVQLTVSTPTGLTATASAPLVIENTLLNNQKRLQNEVNELSNIITALTNEVTQLTNQVTSLQGQNTQLKNNNEQLKAQMTNITDLYNLAQQQISSLKGQFSQLNQQINTLQGNNQQLHNNITSLGSQIGSLQAQLGEAKANITQLNNLLSQRQDTIFTLIGGILAVIVGAGASIFFVSRRK